MDTSSMPKGIANDRLTGNGAQPVEDNPSITSIDKAMVTSQLNGSLVRVVNINDLKGYFNYRSSDTGHVIFTVRNGDLPGEYHLLIIQGKPVAAYSDGSSLYGSALVEALVGVSGTIEYYFIQEQAICSVLDMYPQIARGLEIKPEPAIPAGKKAGVDQLKASAGKDPAIPADSSLSQKPVSARRPGSRQAKGQASDSAMAEIGDWHAYSIEDGQHAHAFEPVKPLAPAPASVPAVAVMPANKILEDAAIGDDDLSYMKNIEAEFESNIDTLLNRLKLTHLKMQKDKKKLG